MLQRPRLMWPVIVLFLVAGIGAAVYYMMQSKTDDRSAAGEALARRDFRAAGDHLDAHLASHPDDLDAVFLAAQTARRGDDFTKASHLLRIYRQKKHRAAEIDRESRLARAQGGDVREAVALIDEPADTPDRPLGLEAAARGILRALDPDPAPGLMLSAAAQPLLGQVVRAADGWLESRTSPADRAAGLVWRGRARGLLGDHAAAVADLRAAQALDPGSAEVQLHLAYLIVQSNPAEAAALLTALRQQQPANRDLRFVLAGSYRGIGRLDEAARVLDELIAENGNDTAARLDRGLVALDAGNMTEAEKHLNRALELAPTIPDTSLALSRLMLATDRPAQAKQYREQYLRLEAEWKKRQSDPPRK